MAFFGREEGATMGGFHCSCLYFIFYLFPGKKFENINQLSAKIGFSRSLQNQIT